MDTLLRRLTPDLLPVFSPYLTSQAAEALRQGEPVAAVGALRLPHSVGAVAGMATEGRLNLGSLFVDEAVRRQGVGSALLAALAEQTGAKELQAGWALPRAEHEALAGFFRSRGFSVTEVPGSLFLVDTAALRQTPVLRRAFLPGYRPDGNVLPLTEFTRQQLRELAADGDIDPCLRYAPLSERCVPELTLGYRYGGRIAAYVAVTDGGDGSLALRAAVSREESPPGAFVQLIMAMLSRLVSSRGDTVFWIDAAADGVAALTERLCGPAARPCTQAAVSGSFS